MGWIYLAESVESESHLASGLEQSPIVSKTDMHRVFCCPECNLVTLTELQFLTMCAICELNTSSQSQKLYSVDSPAKISVLQEMVQNWTVSAQDSSLKYAELLASFDRPSFSWKTYQLSLFEDLTAFSWSSLRWGMTVDGQLSQPKALEPHTEETDGFCWPTPTVCGNYQNKGNMIGLATAVKRWPTPCARDWKDSPGQKDRGERDDSKLAMRVFRENNSGQLNPMWVEWLMGYKIGHTELSASVIQWFQSKSKRRLKSYLEGTVNENP